MLTKVLAMVLVVLIGLALGIETARYVHAHATGVDVSGAVNIHHALGFGLLATSGALLLSLSREWFSRQWTRFTVWFELTLDGLFDFDALDVGDGTGPVVLRGDDAKQLLTSLKNHASPREMARRRQIPRERSANPFVELAQPNPSENGACAQDALDDAAKTACTGCGVRGHWWPDCPGARTPPQREGRQHSEALFFQGGHGRTRARRHTETSCSMLSRDPDINGGDLCITGTRIPIWILWDARSGSNFQEYIDNLRMDYPNLSPEQIKAALQYAFSHPSEIDKDRFRHEVEECEGSETERQLAHPSGTK